MGTGPVTVRVAVDASCLAWPATGTQRYLRSVLEQLANEPRLDLRLVTNAWRPVVGIDNVREVARRVKGGPLWRATALLAEARRADVLWSPWLTVPELPFHPPLVVTALDISPVLHPGTKPGKETRAMPRTGRRGVERATQVLCISETTARDLREQWAIAPARLSVVPLAISPSFTPGDRAEALAAVARRWPIPGSYLLAVGTVEPRKGYELLAGLAERVQLPIVIAGRDGPGGDAVRAELGDACILLGGVTDQELLDLYRAAEALLVPSVYEGFGLTPMEAMACGTPAVVAAGSGALEEIYADVAVVAPREVDAWVDALGVVLSERANRVAAGLALARSRTWEQVAAETTDVLLAAAGQPERRQ